MTAPVPPMLEPHAEHPPTPRGFWIGLAIGVPIMALGVRGAISEAARTHPPELARWVIGSALVHDGLLLPIVAAVAYLARRVVPDQIWPGVRWAMFTTAVLGLIGWPFVRGYGRSTNRTLFPRNYGMGLAVAIGLVWAAAALWMVVRWRFPRRR